MFKSIELGQLFNIKRLWSSIGQLALMVFCSVFVPHIKHFRQKIEQYLNTPNLWKRQKTKSEIIIIQWSWIWLPCYIKTLV